MKLEIEVSEQDLLEFGKQAVEKEIQDSLERLRLRATFTRLSKEIREAWNEEDYWKEVNLARQEVWESYKDEMGL